jgi:hypothetical protein
MARNDGHASKAFLSKAFIFKAFIFKTFLGTRASRPLFRLERKSGRRDARSPMGRRCRGEFFFADCEL